MADETEKVTGDGGQQPETDAPETTEDGQMADGQTEAGENTGEDGDDKPKRSSKEIFAIADAQTVGEDGNLTTAVNADGLLTHVPKPIKDPNDPKNVLYSGWDVRKHVPLKKNDFVDEVTYIRFQAFRLKVKAAIMLKDAEQKIARADQLAQFGSEAARKNVAKLVVMREALAVLQQSLVDSGVDISSLPNPQDATAPAEAPAA